MQVLCKALQPGERRLQGRLFIIITSLPHPSWSLHPSHGPTCHEPPRQTLPTNRYSQGSSFFSLFFFFFSFSLFLCFPFFFSVFFLLFSFTWFLLPVVFFFCYICLLCCCRRWKFFPPIFPFKNCIPFSNQFSATLPRTGETIKLLKICSNPKIFRFVSFPFFIFVLFLCFNTFAGERTTYQR